MIIFTLLHLMHILFGMICFWGFMCFTTSGIESVPSWFFGAVAFYGGFISYLCIRELEQFLRYVFNTELAAAHQFSIKGSSLKEMEKSCREIFKLMKRAKQIQKCKRNSDQEAISQAEMELEESKGISFEDIE